MVFTLHVKIRCKPEKQKEAVFLFRSMLEAAPQEIGYIFYDLTVSDKDPCEFHVYEQWKDQEAFHTHLESQLMKQFRSRYAELLASPNEVTCLKRL